MILNATLSTILELLGGAGVVGAITTIVLFALKWAKNWKLQKATEQYKEAESYEVSAKTERIRIENDLLIAREYKEWAKQLREEQQAIKLDLVRIQAECDRQGEELEASHEALSQMGIKYQQLQHEHDQTKKDLDQARETIRQLEIERENLLTQIKRFEHNRGRPG